MYFIDNPNELIGKTIGFVNMERFSEYILIATTDGGIICIAQNGDDDGDKEIYIPRKWSMEKYIFENRYFLEELIKTNVITKEEVEEYKEKRRKEIEEANKKYFIDKEEAERQQYERLKAKFESNK